MNFVGIKHLPEMRRPFDDDNFILHPGKIEVGFQEMRLRGRDGIIQLTHERGGLDYARDQALAYAQRATAELEHLPEGPALHALRESIVYAVERSR